MVRVDLWFMAIAGIPRAGAVGGHANQNPSENVALFHRPHPWAGTEGDGMNYHIRKGLFLYPGLVTGYTGRKWQDLRSSLPSTLLLLQLIFYLFIPASES